LVVILISGRGSNMRALIEAGLPVSAVISNRAEAEGLKLAAARGIATRVVEHRAHATREAFDGALATEIDRFAPRVVALAGFMRVLTPGFVGRYREPLLNIHPSLLPAFPGLDTHRRALAAGVKVHGCTVHFVTSELDHGPIVVQAALPVRADDDEASLAARVHLHPPGRPLMATGRADLDVNYLLHREQVERVRALRAANPRVGAVHERMATLYRQRIEDYRRTVVETAPSELADA
jgi:phosphoribosylglycinamide formyltransferase 1